MCGITGFLRTSPADKTLLEAMAVAIQHRGPDHAGFFIDGGLGLAMNRLSIIDLTGGNQPMHSPDGQVSLIFNGEIYNFRELRERLKDHAQFRTRSDTEVILNGYLAWGDEIFSRLNGMFSIALWDGRIKKLLLVRDAVGIKPLYFSADQDALYFSSELKSFTGTGLANRANPDAVLNYLCAGYVFRPNTALMGVQQLEPGLLMKIDSDLRIEKRIYRTIAGRAPQSPITDAAGLSREAHAAIVDAVVRQTVADVPFGLLLSAGLDSMAILASLRERDLAANLQTFTVHYGEGSFSEHHVVNRLAAEWGFINHSLLLTADHVRDRLPHVFKTFDNLELLPTCVAIHAASHLAGAQCRVLLAGNGGDELFLGYPTYKATNALRRFPGLGRLASVLRPVADLLPISDNYLTGSERLRRFLLSASADPLSSHMQWRHVFTGTDLRGMMSEADRLPETEAIYAAQRRYFEAARDAGHEDMDTLMIGDMQTWLVDCGLMMWDKAGMSASAEIRVPLIDSDLIEFLKGIPQGVRAPRPGSKSFMRGLFAGDLPDYVLSQPKHGFQAPIASWLRGSLGTMFRELTAALPSDLIARSAVDRMWRDFDEHRRDNALKLWTLGCLAGWASVHNVRLS